MHMLEFISGKNIINKMILPYGETLFFNKQQKTNKEGLKGLCKK